MTLGVLPLHFTPIYFYAALLAVMQHLQPLFANEWHSQSYRGNMCEAAGGRPKYTADIVGGCPEVPRLFYAYMFALVALDRDGVDPSV